MTTDNNFNEPPIVQAFVEWQNNDMRRRLEMDEYIQRMEKKIFQFKQVGPSAKLEIMREILSQAETFIEYYTEE